MSKKDEFLFEGGPTVALVEQWKAAIGAVFLTEFEEGDTFVWRSLNRKEFKDIMKIEGADSLYREERICEKCVLWPENYDFLAMTVGKAGAPTVLSEQIMDRSGFVAKAGPVEL